MRTDSSCVFCKIVAGQIPALKVFEDDTTLREIWVEGEVSTFTRASSGHCYFTLKDAGAEIRCVMWRDVANAQRQLPQHGDQVLGVERAEVQARLAWLIDGCPLRRLGRHRRRQLQAGEEQIHRQANDETDEQFAAHRQDHPRQRRGQ